MNPTAHTLLLEIDALLDTRMGTMLHLCPEINTVLDIEAYRGRRFDDVHDMTQGKISNEQFHTAYKERTSAILRKSIITGIMPILMAHLEGIVDRYNRGIEVSSVSIDLNTFPYVLAGPELELLKNTLSSLVPVFVKVNCVFFNSQEQKVEKIKTFYNGWITYEFHPWLERNYKTLMMDPARELTVILPKLFQRELGENEEGEGKRPFADVDKHGLFEMAMEDFIHLEHIDVDDFCFVMPNRYKLS